MVRALVLVSVLALGGCAPVYAPNNVHAPMLERQGDVQAGAHVGTSGLELQAAAALTDHLGVLADFSLADREDDAAALEDREDAHRHRFGEVGVGYFDALGRAGHVSVYGGYGRGWAEASDTYDLFGSNTVMATGRYNRFFLQPGLGVTAGPLQIHAAARFVRLNFYEFETSRVTVSTDQTEIFVEPAMGVSLGADRARIGVQAGLSRPLSDPDEVAFDYQPLWIAVGLQLRMNLLAR